MYIVQSGWISRELCWLKKPVLQDGILYESIYITFFKCKLIQIKNRLQEVREVLGVCEESGCGYKNATEGICDDENLLYVAAINVNILVIKVQWETRVQDK